MIHKQFQTQKSNILIYILNQEEISDAYYTNSEYKQIIQRSIDIPSEHIYMMEQVHGDRLLNTTDFNKAEEFPKADSIYTAQKGLALVVKSADCLPVLLWNDEGSYIAAIHSGWKGVKENITTKTIEFLKQKYSGKNHTAYLAPSIRKDNYEIKEDVAQYFKNFPKNIITKVSDSYYLSLDQAVQYKLQDEKIRWIDSNINTYTNPLFFSHRKGSRARNLNIILMK